jgi:hypothetical protein
MVEPNNITIIEDPMAGYYHNPFLVTVLVSTYLVLQLGGNGLLVGIMSYEKWGQDNHKRNLINRLVYQASGFAILSNMTTLHFFIGRLLFGPLSKLKL